MILSNLTARMSTADPAPAQVSFVAVGPCGCEVTWRQVYGHDPVPGACEKAPCGASESALSASRISRQEDKRAPAADLAESDGCSNPYKEGLQ